MPICLWPLHHPSRAPPFYTGLASSSAPLTTGNPPLCSTTATNQSSRAENCSIDGETNKNIEISNYELCNKRKYLNNESVEEACEKGTIDLFLLEPPVLTHSGLQFVPL